MRLGTNLLSVFFFILGLIITKKVKATETSTAFELETKLSQIHALKGLWVVIIFFLVSNIGLFIFDVYAFINQKTCLELEGDLNKITNMALMLLNRILSHFVLVWPIIWLFWQKPRNPNSIRNPRVTSNSQVQADDEDNLSLISEDDRLEPLAATFMAYGKAAAIDRNGTVNDLSPNNNSLSHRLTDF